MCLLCSQFADQALPLEIQEYTLTLQWAIGSGATLTLPLRSPDDTTATETVSVTLQYLMQTYNVTLPVRLPYGLANPLTEVGEPELPHDAPSAPSRVGLER